MNELRTILVGQVERLVADAGGVAPLREVEAGGLPRALWDALSEQGLPLGLVPEAAGGAGLAWGDAAAIWQALGRHGAPVPVGEAMLAGALLTGAGIAPPAGVIALGARAAPFGRHAGHALLLADGRLALHAVAAATPGANTGREPRDEVLPGALLAQGAPCSAHGPRALVLGLALLRAALIAGALERVLALAVDWANTRRQFGRPIGRFQAVQQQLAAMAGEVAAAQVAVQNAARAVDARGLADAGFEIGCAKVVAGEAATLGAATAHQVFAAIGITEDHVLHHFTRRLWSWRAEGGSERAWAAELGRAAIARGGSKLWADLTARDVTGQAA